MRLRWTCWALIIASGPLFFGVVSLGQRHQQQRDAVGKKNGRDFCGLAKTRRTIDKNKSQVPRYMGLSALSNYKAVPKDQIESFKLLSSTADVDSD
jgi:hypothetical protein